MTKCIKKSYDVSFKLQVLSDYYLSGKSKNFTCKKWGISFPALLEWLAIWPVEEKDLPLLDEIMSRYRMEARNNLCEHGSSLARAYVHAPQSVDLRDISVRCPLDVR